ncbi:urease accessory protein [Roseovarius azorensis]|uniref:Urease accessory protein UreD n=1 Tax=Roseovarius azorensis TaxID=1287727 RepID=A0A1H7QC62_9RHOB|nr:urease accessory protein UreD [Roseovarius azorensis]SEL45700.1 urease accessory protein [Roseovarius azorensis]
MTACPAIQHQRSTGAVHVSLLPGPSGAGLNRLHQAGSARAFVHPGRSGPEVVFLNTSGGLAEGDTLDYRLDLGTACRATATTQTAERAYRSTGSPARVTVLHRLAEGAHLDWLPQETILFDHSALHRETEIDLGKDASCLLLEAVVLGRAAMGETLNRLALDDRRMVRRTGTPVLFEPLRIHTEALAAGPGILAGARAFATLTLVAQGAEDALGPVRAMLSEPDTSGGASGFDGKLIIRLMARDGWPLRRQILRLLSVLRPGPPPQVWQI